MDVIIENGLYINTKFRSLFKEIFDKQKDKKDTYEIDIEHPILNTINKKLRSKNYYALDKYGIVIRLKELNKKTLFGYVKNEDNELINININKLALEFKNEDLLYNTILYFKNKYKKKFFTSTCLKIYKELYPEIMKKLE